MRFDELTPEERERVLEDEKLWQRAARIVSRHPALDPSDVYHQLHQLRRSPAERLAIGLRRGRLGAHRS
jgi:hypothetical protein